MWQHTFDIYDAIFEFLEKKFPGDLIIPAFDNIDIMIVNQKIPVEIQTTIFDRSGIRSSRFEKRIQRQLEQNIKIFGKCWFFFDEDYLKYLQNDAGRNVSINLNWFYDSIEEEKLKVFTISEDGKIIQKCLKDFEFIKRFSNPDSTTLHQNKMKMAKNIFNNNNISMEEMKKLRKQFNESHEKDFQKSLSRTDSSDRERSIAHILNALGSLDIVNIALDCKAKNNTDLTKIHFFNYLGLLETIYGQGPTTIRIFIDKYDIAKYFPGYLRNKEMWDYLKESKMKLNSDQLNAIITGRVNPLEWKALIQGGW